MWLLGIWLDSIHLETWPPCYHEDLQQQRWISQPIFLSEAYNFSSMEKIWVCYYLSLIPVWILYSFLFSILLEISVYLHNFSYLEETLIIFIAKFLLQVFFSFFKFFLLSFSPFHFRFVSLDDCFLHKLKKILLF